MKTPVVILALFALLCLPAGSQQQPPRTEPTTDPDKRLPNGKLQRDEILKAEFEKSLKDAADLVRLSEELKAEMEKDDRFVFSISSLKKTEEIEKLARRIRTRMKRY